MPPFSSLHTTTTQTSSPPSIATMRQQLSNESFSFSWQDGAVPPFEVGSDKVYAYEFDFGLAWPHRPTLADADQIFSNGFLLPLHVVNQSESESVSESSSCSTLSRSLSLDSSDSYISFSKRFQSQCSPRVPISGTTKSKLPFLRNCARKYLSFFLPLSKKARKLRLTRSDTGRTLSGGDDFSSVQRYRGNKIFDDSYESGINEAILHCKKSAVIQI